MYFIRHSLFAFCLTGALGVQASSQGNPDSLTAAVVNAERALSGRSVARRTVAVLPFAITTTDSALAALGYGLAELLSDDLAHSHRLTMVERLRLADLQREQGFSWTGAVDRESSVRVGRMLAAQHLIFGSIDASGSGTIKIDARAANVESGATEMQQSLATPADAMFGAERDLVMHALSAFGVTLTSDEKRELYERVAPTFRAFISFSRGVRAEQQGNDDIAIASFDEAASLDHNFKLAATRLAAARHRAVTRATSLSATEVAPKEDASTRETAGDAVRDTKASAKDEPKAAGSATVARDEKGSVDTPVTGSAPSGEATSSSVANNRSASAPPKKSPAPPRHRTRNPPSRI